MLFIFVHFIYSFMRLLAGFLASGDPLGKQTNICASFPPLPFQIVNPRLNVSDIRGHYATALTSRSFSFRLFRENATHEITTPRTAETTEIMVRTIPYSILCYLFITQYGYCLH